MNELMVKDDVRVENMIYEIRGVQVMLDSDWIGYTKLDNFDKDMLKYT